MSALQMTFERDTAWEETLDRRAVLPLNPASPVAIKRDLHTFDVDVSSRTFATAFHAAMIDTSRRFGLVQVFRKRNTRGTPFTLGERFQGCFRIRHAIRDGIASSPAVARALRRVEGSLSRLYERVAEPIHFIEDGWTS